MRLILTPLLFLSSIALSQPEIPEDFFDTPSAKEIAAEAKELADQRANETEEEKRDRLEQEQRTARENAEAMREFNVRVGRVANKSLERNKDDRLDSLISALQSRDIYSIGLKGASQATQVNTDAIVRQNTIIIYQNERIIELLEGLQTK